MVTSSGSLVWLSTQEVASSPRAAPREMCSSGDSTALSSRDKISKSPSCRALLISTRGGPSLLVSADSKWALNDGQGRPLLADPSNRGEWRSSPPAVSNDGEMVAERSSFFEVQLRSAANATPIGNPF